MIRDFDHKVFRKPTSDGESKKLRNGQVFSPAVILCYNFSNSLKSHGSVRLNFLEYHTGCFKLTGEIGTKVTVSIL